jgi:hypothetical protein
MNAKKEISTYSKLSKMSFVIDALLKARETLLNVDNIENIEKRDELLETITSAIDETYNLMELENDER